MRLLVIRHAIAEDSAEWEKQGLSDAARPLSAKGRRRMRRAARGLRRVIRDVEVIATSPLVRAVQTAEIVGEAYPGVEIIEAAELAPGRTPNDLWAWLSARSAIETVAIVGHEPGLSRCVSHGLADGDRSFVELRKGAACLMVFDDGIGAHRGMLSWVLTPRHLRMLA